MAFLRYGLPALICTVGIVWGVARNMDQTGLEIAILLIAAGTSLLLITALFRMGLRGDTDRDDEEAAREFFDRHGYWEDDPPPA